MKGIVDLYKKKGKEGIQIKFINYNKLMTIILDSKFIANKSSKVQSLSDENREKIKEMLSVEYELYEFIKKRLLSQYNKLFS